MRKVKVERISISLPKELVEKFDALIKEKKYTNRSEAVRDLIREFLIEARWEKKDEKVIGCIVLLYEHELRGVEEKLTSIQHEFKKVVSSMHVHIDEHTCMEILVVRGKAAEVKTIADVLISERGVKYGKLIAASSVE
jgi:CopG family nickel-responsive transcriptional regulator